MTLELTPEQKKLLAKAYVPPVSKRSRANSSLPANVIGASVSILYSACDATIALSRKSAKQLSMLAEKNHQSLNLQIIPTGVNALPVAGKKTVQSFRESLGLAPNDQVVLYVGRLGEEKNLAMLIPMMEKLIRKRPNAKMVFVGDFDFRETLEKMATQSRAAGKVLFAGRLPRNDLSMAYQAADVFVFPSLTDTQGLVIQEAAHAGLPLVLCDPDVSECFQDGKNGFLAKNTPRDVAGKIATILLDDTLRATFSSHSKKLAESLSERTQAEKVVALFRQILKKDQSLK